jgi:prepilin-type N-terminal cleavage/methylation domain-containing protein
MKGGNGRKKKGFTLIELMLALTLLSIIAMGLTAGNMLSRRNAEGAIHESTAITIATGYLEQLKSMEYQTILASVNDPQIPLPTKINQGTLDPIFLEQWNPKKVTLNINAQGEVTQTMVVEVRPSIMDMSANGERILGMEMVYRWQRPPEGVVLERAIRSARAWVPTF